MKHYSTYAIEQFANHVQGDVAAFNWLINNDYKELIATLDAIRDDKKAFKFLIESYKNLFFNSNYKKSLMLNKFIIIYFTLNF